MTLNVSLDEVPFAILETVKARILANRRRLQDQQRPRPSLRPRPQFTRIGASSKAWRLPRPAATVMARDGGFRFIDVFDHRTPLSKSDPAYNVANKITPSSGLDDASIVRVFIKDFDYSCFLTAPPVPQFFGNQVAGFVNFVQDGGVLWINTEFEGCGHPVSVFNKFLSDNFSTTMRVAGSYFDRPVISGIGPFVYEVEKSNLLYTPQSGIAPPHFYTSASDTIIGGTPYYGIQSNVVVAFDRIGDGVLVLSGDANGTNEYPSFSDSSNTFIDALLALIE